MENFITVDDIKEIEKLIQLIRQFKDDPESALEYGNGKSVGLFFFNPSLRTRLSTQRAAQNLGMNVISNNMKDGWPLEFETGAIMDQDKSEHVKEAAQVIAQYFDIIGIRAFPMLEDLETDYSNPVLRTFNNLINRPLLNLESGSAHPCQGLTDIFTIEEHKELDRPKVVLSWAPHPKALPHSVANSFLRFADTMNYDVHVVNPIGYDLAVARKLGITQHRDQNTAFEGAHFVYAKNWSASEPYGAILERSSGWMIDQEKMKTGTNTKFMHCLPVRRNVVVSDAVLNSNRSLVIQQAQNRMWSAMGVLAKLANQD